MCFFGGSNKSQPVVAQPTTPVANMNTPTMADQQDAQRRRMAAADANAGGDAAMTAQATAAPKTVLGA